MSETDSAVFHRTTPDEHGNFHEFRLVPSDGGDLVIRQLVVRTGTATPLKTAAHQWALGEFLLLSDELPAAKSALQDLLATRKSKET
jgi:hypothetical protein